MLPSAPPAIGVTDGEGGICDGCPNPPEPAPPGANGDGGPPGPGGPPPGMPAASAWVGPPPGRPGGIPPPPGLPRPDIPGVMGEGTPPPPPMPGMPPPAGGAPMPPATLPPPASTEFAAPVPPGRVAAPPVPAGIPRCVLPVTPCWASVPPLADAPPGVAGTAPRVVVSVLAPPGSPLPGIGPTPLGALTASVGLEAGPGVVALPPVPAVPTMFVNGKGSPSVSAWLFMSPLPKGKGSLSVPAAFLLNSSLVGSCVFGGPNCAPLSCNHRWASPSMPSSLNICWVAAMIFPLASEPRSVASALAAAIRPIASAIASGVFFATRLSIFGLYRLTIFFKLSRSSLTALATLSLAVLLLRQCSAAFARRL